jgi:hypothetical protein
MDDANEDMDMLLYKLDTAKTDLEIFSILLQRYGANETRVLLTALARVENLAMAMSKASTRYPSNSNA